jgi:ubiquinol-cytochrome c reductase cytochrome b subunit
VVAMFASILLLFFLPGLDTSPVRSGHYRPLFRKFFWFGLIPSIIVLGYCGGSHASEGIVLVSQIAAAYYFAHFLIILPIVSRIEQTKPLPNSITESVLAKYGQPALQPAE